MTTVTSTEARKDWSELLNRVRYGGERVTIERRGKTMAVLVSPEEEELLEALEDQIDVMEARKVLETDNREPIPLEEVVEKLGV